MILFLTQLAINKTKNPRVVSMIPYKQVKLTFGGSILDLNNIFGLSTTLSGSSFLEYTKSQQIYLKAHLERKYS